VAQEDGAKVKRSRSKPVPPTAQPGKHKAQPGKHKVPPSKHEPPPDKPAARHYAPRGIAGLLAPVLRPAFKRRAPAAAALLADWDTLAGPALAARATPVKFAGGTLTLGCTGPVAMELQLVGPQIIERLNLALGNAMIERLRFEQRAPALRPLPAAGLSAPPVAPPPGLPDGPLGEALAKLHQGVMSRRY
jgi:hypothetical protein